ncbi:MAG: 2-oxoacid:acceptor oxidoreductase family protein [Candidatus Bathyarchaeota archaeon]|nr:2-oxoacid:acceptor oxidoreductase family protein [Candidatus Bathyarchaeota archaeon]
MSVNAATLAEKAGDVITQNIVMIGALAATGKLPLKIEILKEALRELVPVKYLEINMRAFELGYDTVKMSHASV